jgi:hypothetical protein
MKRRSSLESMTKNLSTSKSLLGQGLIMRTSKCVVRSDTRLLKKRSEGQDSKLGELRPAPEEVTPEEGSEPRPAEMTRLKRDSTMRKKKSKAAAV